MHIGQMYDQIGSGQVMALVSACYIKLTSALLYQI